MVKNRMLFFVLLWGASVGAGLSFLYYYNNKPGRVIENPEIWPEISRLKPLKNYFQLVIAAHPKCPCTNATLEELDWILAKTNGRMKATILFLQPKNFPMTWSKTRLWYKAEKIKGITLFLDEEGKEAQIFGAMISGQVLLYDPNGRLVFSGGITPSRGHSGSNVGRSTIVALVNGQRADYSSTPFFGCPLK